MPNGLSDATLLRLWRKAVWRRWSDTCAFCGSAEKLECHHIVPRKHRLLRFDARNGILACRGCHKHAATLRGKRALWELLSGDEYEYLSLLETHGYAPWLKLRRMTDVVWRGLERRGLEEAIDVE